MQKITTFKEFAKHADFEFINTLQPNPQSNKDGIDFYPREVKSGHYVLVRPTPLPNPKFIIHSKKFFEELGLDEKLLEDEDFIKFFSANLSNAQEPLKKVGWATGYALSIYGMEYYSQCPFGTGNGYGDGRAISVFESVFHNKRYEMQLKGAGQTPYCRGADGKAVLRSSIREFLAQELMQVLGVPTTRSFSLFASSSEFVRRPWFSYNSKTSEPNVMISEPTAITTRVASSFLRVGQLELFGRRARKNEHQNAKKELKEIVAFAIKREYSNEIDTNKPFQEQVIQFAKAFAKRLAKLVSNWIRVGYCQGNFNSDNTAIGGFTLDYGPFGYIEDFHPNYQPWTGGGMHFSFFNQPKAAHKNFLMFAKSLEPLLDEQHLGALEKIKKQFIFIMQQEMIAMWKRKLGLKRFDANLFNELIFLMKETPVDFTIFFRELSHIPKHFEAISKSFYFDVDANFWSKWQAWFENWKNFITDEAKTKEEMLKTNPKYILREWMLKEAYTKAYEGEYLLLYELNELIQNPYSEQSAKMEQKYYRKKPIQYFDVAGISFISCSS